MFINCYDLGQFWMCHLKLLQFFIILWIIYLKKLNINFLNEFSYFKTYTNKLDCLSFL